MGVAPVCFWSFFVGPEPRSNLGLHLAKKIKVNTIVSFYTIYYLYFMYILMTSQGVWRYHVHSHAQNCELGVVKVNDKVTAGRKLTANIPNVSDVSDVSDVPDVPDVPNVPDVPGLSCVPDYQDVPDVRQLSLNFYKIRTALE
jgi:hypothetical protein